MFIKYEKIISGFIFFIFLYGLNIHAFSDCVIATVGGDIILASQVGTPSIYTSFAPATLDNWIDFYALQEKANKLSFFNPSQIKIDEYKRSLIAKLGLENKNSNEVDAELKNVLQKDLLGLTKDIIAFFKVSSMIETFVNAKVSFVHKSEVESYCNKNPKHANPSFTVLVSEDISLKRYLEIKEQSTNKADLEKALNINGSLAIVLNASEIESNLLAILESTELNTISNAIESKKSAGDVFVVKVLNKSPKRLLTPMERYNEVSSIIMSQKRDAQYKSILDEARKECAIKYNIPKNNI